MVINDPDDLFDRTLDMSTSRERHEYEWTAGIYRVLFTIISMVSWKIDIYLVKTTMPGLLEQLGLYFSDAVMIYDLDPKIGAL